VLWNAAASLIVAGTCTDLKEGMTQAAFALDRGAAKETLATLVRITNTASHEG